MERQWYYVSDGQQNGPLAENALIGLVASGQLAPDTLIWCEGMEGWVQFRDVEFAGASPVSPHPPPVPPVSSLSLSKEGTASPAAERMVWCAECGSPKPVAETIQYGSSTVCAQCKPILLQRLREGGTIRYGSMEGATYGGFWIRAVALLLDQLIIGLPLVGMVIAVSMMMGVAFEESLASNWMNYGLAIPITAFEAFMLIHYGATPGKLILKLRVTNFDGSKLGTGQAIIRCVWSTFITLIPVIGFLLYIIECSFAASDPEKRALHDRMFQTRVILLDR